MQDESPDFFETFKLLAPYLALTVLVTLMAVMLLLRFTPNLATPPAVVSFDVLRYTNAQRAVASAFIGKNADVLQANDALLDLPQRARATIQEVAGEGTLVVLKQAVIQGQTRDITEEVLTKLGLPVNVPVADSPAYVMDELTPNALIGVNPGSRRPTATQTAPAGNAALP